MTWREAMVIGAGLAGAAVCERLCARGWQVTLIERHPQAAAETSGNHAGSFHPLLARDANRMARLTQAGVAYALVYWRGLEAQCLQFGWRACGVLQLSRDDGKSDPATALDANPPGSRRVRAVSRAEASDIAGVPLPGGGVFFEEGGWVQPPQLVAAQLAHCAARADGSFVTHFGREVAAMRRVDGCWQAIDVAGTVIAQAPVVVVAGGASAEVVRWFGQAQWPLESVRGRITLLDGAALAAPRVPVHRDGYVLPVIDGSIVTGASYERAGTLNAEVADRDNLRRLARLLQLPDGRALAPLAQSRSAARAVARDRLPVIGALPDAAALTHALVTRNGVRLADLPRLPGAYVAGAYGSRGLTWAALGAEVLACELEGVTAPLEGALRDAVDPARFAFRALRRETP